MKHLLLGLALVTALGSYGLQNFSDYEQNFPIAIFQIAFAFNIYYNYAIRVEEQNMNKGVFAFICILKRYFKFIFFSLFYFQKFIRDITGFFSILNYMCVVGVIFITVPLSTWKYLYQKVYLFRFLIIVAETEFIALDIKFIWTQTIQSPQKIVLFSKPEYEFVFIAHFMGIMSYLLDCVIQYIRRDKFMPAFSGIKAFFQWGFGGLLGYLGFIYFNELQELLGLKLGHSSDDAFLFARKIFFIYYLYLGAYLVKSSQSVKPFVKIEQQTKTPTSQDKKKQ